MKTTFGVTQILKHPPKWLVPIYSILMVLICVALLQIKGDPLLSQKSKDVIEHYLITGQLVLTALAPFFGVEPINTIKKP